MPVVSGFFPTQVVGALRPPAQVEQWDRNARNPFGLRHWESGNYRPSAKIGLVGGFDAQAESGRAIDFGMTEVEDAGFLTETVTLTFNLGEVNSHPDSFFDQMLAAGSVATNFKAFNLKFWRGSVDAFTASGITSPNFFFETSSGWLRGRQVDTSSADALPTAIPQSGNVFFRSSEIFVSGAYKDLEFSDFIYLRGQFPSGVFPLGTYGGIGDRDFTFKFSYDWTDINAEVLLSDLEACLESQVQLPTPGIQASGSLLVDGLVGFWKLDENSPRLDSIGNVHLDDINTVTCVSGVSTKTVFASQFTAATSGYLESGTISSSQRVDFGNEDFTVACWVYLDSKSGDQTIISKWDEQGNQRQYKIEYDSGVDRLRFFVSTNGTAEASVTASNFGSPVTGQWMSVIAWHDSFNDTINISVNNGPIDSAAHAGGVFQSTSELRMGTQFNSSGAPVSLHDGRIDSAAAYNLVMSSGQRVAFHNNGSGIQLPFEIQGAETNGIRTAWRLNEASGFPRFDIIGGARLDNIGGVKDVVGLVGSGSEFKRTLGTYLQSSGNELTAFNDADYTLLGFFKLDNQSPSGITPLMSKWSDELDELEYMLFIDSNVDAKLKYAWTTDGTYGTRGVATASGVMASGFWHMFAVRHDASTDIIDIRLDDDVDNSVATSGGMYSGTAPFWLGGMHPSGVWLDGTLDDFHFWDRRLTNDELGGIYANV